MDECDCDGNTKDCKGVCGGPAEVDECGNCGGNGIPVGFCSCDGKKNDCMGVCGGHKVVDECGVCGGLGIRWDLGKCNCE